MPTSCPHPNPPGRWSPRARGSAALLAANPNYFGTAPELGDFPVVAPQKFNRTYEQLTCVSYSPRLDRLEATFIVKLPTGYSGGLCTPGSYEHVRFYIDYGAGWEDAGLASVNVHDIPVATDCHKDRTHPLAYTCGVDHQPRRDWCGRPVLPRVRAILSWSAMPPAGQPDWPAPWGNRLDCNVQILPRRRSFLDLLKVIPKDIATGLKLPPIEQLEVPESPVPDPGPLALVPLAELAESYKQAEVPEHRFALPHMAKAIAASADQLQLTSAAVSAKAAGISLQNVLDTLEKDAATRPTRSSSASASSSRAAATGWSPPSTSARPAATRAGRARRGAPSTSRSGPTGTTTASSSISAPSRPTSTTTPSCRTAVSVTRRSCRSISAGCGSACERPVLRHVRAVLSWGAPPSTTDPELVPHWGNRVDTHVQIAPGRPYDGTARFVIVGGVPAAEIDPATGLTRPVAHLAVNGSPLDARGCPFAGLITLHGPTDPALVGSTYRVLVTQPHDGRHADAVHERLQDRRRPRADAAEPVHELDAGSGRLAAVAGWMENTTGVLGWFTPSGEDRWQIDLEVLGIGIVDTKFVQLDNTLNMSGTTDPVNAADLQLDFAGNCDVRPGVITGRFVARDRHFGSWGLSVQGGPSSGFPTPPPAVTTPLPQLPATSETTLAGRTFEYDLSALPPCGYTVTLTVSDRAIVNSATAGRSGSVSRGLCIRKEPQWQPPRSPVAGDRGGPTLTGWSSTASASASCCSCPCAAARRRRSTG